MRSTATASAGPSGIESLEPLARTRLCSSSAPLSSSTREVAARSRVPLSFRCSERRSRAGELRCNFGRSVIRISPPVIGRGQLNLEIPAGRALPWISHENFK